MTKAKPDNRPLLAASFVGLCLLLVGMGFGMGMAFQGCDFTPAPKPPVVVPVVEPKVDRVVYVYEQRSGSVPPTVAAGLDKLNRAGIEATPFEDDSTDGDGDVPEQYVKPLDAARLAGLPALVVMGNGKVLDIADGGKEVEAIEEILRDHK
jgi:hypothetical protein